MAALLFAAATAADVSVEARAVLVRGAVGDAAAVEFLAWADEQDLPDPERVLANPASFELPERGDRAYAALAAVAAAVVADLTPERWIAGWQVLGRVADDVPDIAATAARVLARSRPAGTAPPSEVRAFLPLLRDAGMIEQ